MSAPYPTDDNKQYPTGAPYPPGGSQMPGYPPQMPGYGGYQGGYAPPPPDVGFVNPLPAQPGYAPGYPPPQQGFAPGFPPQQQGYPSGYPTQPPAFNSSGYPQQPSPYQPNQQPSGYDAAGKPLNPPYMDENDPNFAKGFGFDDKSIRAGFIRRVYSILSIQLLVTLGFVCLMVLHDDVRNFAHRNSQLMIIPMVGTIVLVCIIACCENARRSSPTNIILLSIFTLFESILVGFISSVYKPKIVLLAVGLTAAIVIGLTIFAFQTKYDFTVCGGFLCIVLIIFTLGSLIGALFFRSDFGSFIIACFGAGIFAIYIVYDTQLMMGGDHKYSISPEEYIFAALNLYMDIIQLFLYLLRILRYLNND